MIIRVVDTETCGLPPDNHQVVEVATLDLVRGADLKWTKGRSWSSLVDPGRPIPPEASGVHHITDDMVRGAPRLADLALDIQKDADVYCAHEARFEGETLKGIIDPSRLICTRKCATVFWPDAPNHKNQTLRYYLGLKLQDPAAAVPHRAPGDAYVTAALLRYMLGLTLEGGEVVTPELMLEISARPVLLPKLTFGQHAMQPCAEVPAGYWEWVLGHIKDEDVTYTAKHYLALARANRRDRSPVGAD